MTAGNSKDRISKDGILAAVVAIVVAVVGFLFASSDDSEGSDDSARPSVSASAIPEESREAPSPTVRPEESASSPEDTPDEGAGDGGSDGDGPDDDGNGRETGPGEPLDEADLGPRVAHLADDLNPVERNVYDGTATVALTTYTSSIWKDIGPGRTLSSVYVVYDLQGQWKKFIADVGPKSTSRTDAVMDFEVYADDRKLGEVHRTTMKRSAHIELNVTGVGHLRLVAKHVSGSTSGAYTGQAVWGSARLEG
ncbi:NPCBM/NEW2 domain-containing protein [Streptomyces fructofermentans]|uniref:NPCBM/NEW2 domain-containing protein n=1 Tax=Streptomyces fructofermentans TaxID=152141 RepID=UPI003411D736